MSDLPSLISKPWYLSAEASLVVMRKIQHTLLYLGQRNTDPVNNVVMEATENLSESLQVLSSSQDASGPGQSYLSIPLLAIFLCSHGCPWQSCI